LILQYAISIEPSNNHKLSLNINSRLELQGLDVQEKSGVDHPNLGN
jgi:hypothetical protein